MSPPIAIRAARTDDAPALAQILNEIIAVGGTTALAGEFTADRIVGYFIADAFVCHVAEGPNGLAGVQTIGRHPDLPEGWADIATFARLRPKVPGVGTALFAATRQTAARLGLVAINASIRADNASGLAYYAKMGFATWRVLDAVPLADGTPVDRILKRYDVGPPD